MWRIRVGTNLYMVFCRIVSFETYLLPYCVAAIITDSFTEFRFFFYVISNRGFSSEQISWHTCEEERAFSLYELSQCVSFIFTLFLGLFSLSYVRLSLGHQVWDSEFIWPVFRGHIFSFRRISMSIKCSFSPFCRSAQKSHTYDLQNVLQSCCSR